MFLMKKKMPTVLKECGVGLAYGIACIIPGIAAGSILLITNLYKKITNVVGNLISKNFVRNLLSLLPFGICAIVSFLALVVPIGYALDYCMFSIVCLFVGLIAGSIPSVTDKIKGAPRSKGHIITLIVCFVIASLIGVLSVIFGTNSVIEGLFEDVPFYSYLIVFVVGLVASTGLIVPGFSGSLLLLALCFYEPILQVISDIFKWKNPGQNIGLLACFAIGTLLGFILLSKLMNFLIEKHKYGTYFASLGLICGSIISVFVNSNMFDYIKSDAFGLVDKILGPILLVIGFVLGYLFVRYLRKHQEPEENA